MIELLIVIAIILILIAIALPNFLEAQVRAKVTASRSNMRSIEVAMHSLLIDTGSIHPDYNDFGVSEPQRSGGSHPRSDSGRRGVLQPEPCVPAAPLP